MSEIAARRHPISAVAARREALTKDLETKKAYLKTLQEELKSAAGVDKNRLLWMINSEAASVEHARQNLDSFENPIVLPHLKLVNLTVQFHPDNKEFDVTVWVNNDGILSALGSFELDLSVSYTSEYIPGGPNLTTDVVSPKTTPESTDLEPGDTAPFVFPNFPYVPDPNPNSPGALYTFDVLLFAGPDGVVANQRMHVEYYLKPPRIPRPIVPVPPVAAPF
jgi:hypothetical protein